MNLETIRERNRREFPIGAEALAWANENFEGGGHQVRYVQLTDGRALGAQSEHGCGYFGGLPWVQPFEYMRRKAAKDPPWVR